MATETDLVRYVAGLVIQEAYRLGYNIGRTEEPRCVPVGISARHVHLQSDHLEILFGKGHALTPIKDLSQPGQFAAAEMVSVIGPKGRINKVRILGPVRKKTQVEISASDARLLGVAPVVRDSGDHNGTPGITIEGPAGSVEIQSGVMLADRHIHMSPAEAESFGVQDGQRVRLKIPGRRGGILENVGIRVDQNYLLDLHIDTDEANAFLLKQGEMLEFVK